MRTILPWRLALKALFFFALINLLFSAWNPPVAKFSLYNSVFPGRERLPFGSGPKNNNITVDDLDAMLASHVIAAPKPPGEIRVVLLGDSSIWGERLRAQDILSSQLNALDLECDGRPIRFYNLGYPHPSLLKDLIILDQAMNHDPDLVVWPVTLNSFGNKRPHPFIIANHDRALQIVNQYGLDIRQKSSLEVPEPTRWQRTILAQRQQLARLLQLQSFGLIWTATGYDITFAPRPLAPLSPDVADDIEYFDQLPPANIENAMMLDMLDAGVRMAGDVPVILVNEPIFQATGENSGQRYNSFYPRWAYDQYREILSAYSSLRGWDYIDLWNAVPAGEFTDTPLHLSPAGEQLMAGQLGSAILPLLCK